MEIDKTPTASADMIRVLLKYAVEIGINPNRIDKASGFSPTEAIQTRISIDLYNSIWMKTAALSKDKDFGLHFGERMLDLHIGHVLFSLMMNSPDIGTAVDKFIRYHLLMADIIQPSLVIDGALAYLTWESISPSNKLQRSHIEAILSLFISILRRLVETGIDPVEVHLSYPKPDNIDEYKRIFNSPLLFGKENNRIVFRKDILQLAISAANPELYAVLNHFIKKIPDELFSSITWVDKVKKVIGSLLVNDEKPGLKSVATNLNISTRNLQNKLKEENTSYQMLLDSVRKDMAVKFLKRRELSFLDIAFLLGFSEQSSFNHAFKRWTGTIPSQYKTD